MKKKNQSQSLHIDRPVYQQDDLNRDTLYETPSTSVKQQIKSHCKVDPLECVKTTVPILDWFVFGYKWKWLFGDIVSGVTVTVMQIPQGMGYALLGNVPPITGIYMAFFPVLMYAIFGTSRHTSTGTFAIICLMTGKIVSDQSTHIVLQNGTTVLNENNDNNTSISGEPRTNVQVAITVTFLVAMIQLVMYILRLGVITTMFSESLVKGLTCATSCHVVVSQLKEVFGLQMRKRKGYFNIVLTVYDVGKNIMHSSLAAVGISLVTLIVLLLNLYILKPVLSKKTKIPFPIELFVVGVGTLFSYLTLDVSYLKVPIVGDIPTGLPDITLPVFSIMGDILFQCFVIALVSYAITISMAFLFARKCRYEVNGNQELLAMGISNTVGSFFSCMPTCASVSRSIIQEAVGGCTQMASLVSSILILFVLLWLGPLFESLPKCCLGTLIIMAIWPAVMQFKMVRVYWTLNKLDGIVWMVTFTITLILDIGIGLAAGVAVTILGILVRGCRPYTCLLGVVPNTDLYLDLDRYKAVQEIPNIQIFHYSGMLNFSARQSFTDALKKRLGFDAAKIIRDRISKEEDNKPIEMINLNVKYVILDFGALTYIDPAGIDILRALKKDCEEIGITILIAGCPGPVFETIRRCDIYQKVTTELMFFPTIHDAVIFAQNDLEE